MKINKRLIIAGNEVLLVKEDINLALNWAGKASFIIGSDEELKGLVKYQIGIGSFDTLHSAFIGVVDSCIQLAKGKWQVIARELTGALDEKNPINLRHCTLNDVLKAISSITGLKFVTPDKPYSTKKIPYFYHTGTATQQMQAIGAAFSIPNFTWYLQSNQTCFVGAYEESFGYDKSLEVAAHQATKVDGKTMKLPLLPALRPGIKINGNKITELKIEGSFMVAKW
jgi:hypothetical protein